MNKIQLIVTDLDKTLLNDNEEISLYTKSVLEKCVANNIKVAYATARPLRATNIFYNEFRPDGIIFHNGAEIMVDNIVLKQIGIDKEMYNKIMASLLKYRMDITYAIEMNDKIYSNFNASKYWNNITAYNINEKPDDGIIDKMILEISNDNEINDIKRLLPEEIYIEKSQGAMNRLLGLILNKKATKYNGIKELCKYWEIGIENVAAFGDNENDYEMVRKCGKGIMVNNASDKYKEGIKYICKSNNEDGVGHWIEENILNEMA
jgi:Cof subfamily protein (haloacid dehalogenase superfamily)